MKVIDNVDQADFSIVLINATALINFEVSVRCFSSQIQVFYNEDYLFRIFNFAKAYSKRIKFLVVNTDQLEITQNEQNIIRLIMTHSYGYPVYEGDIYFETEYKRLLDDIYQHYLMFIN